MQSTSSVALIFDLDGTLRDTRLATYLQLRDYAVKHRIEAPSYGRVMEEVHKRCLKGTIQVLFPSKLEQPVQAELAVEEINRSYVEFYLPVYARPIDGGVGFLGDMSAQGHRIAVVSNGSKLMVDQSLKDLGLSGVVDCAITPEDAEPKPSPSGILRALKCLDVGRDQALYVGDTSTDIIAGRSANVMTVGVLSGIGTREELQRVGADFVVRSVGDLGFIVHELERR